MKRVLSLIVVLILTLQLFTGIVSVKASDNGVGISSFRLKERIGFLNDVDFGAVAETQNAERQAKIDAMVEMCKKDDITFSETDGEKLASQLETGFSIAAAISSCVPGAGDVAAGILQVCAAIAGEGKKTEAEKTQEMLMQMMERIDARFEIVDAKLDSIQDDIQAGIQQLEQNSNYRSLMESHRDNMMAFDSDIKYIDESNITHYSGYSTWRRKLQSKYDEIQACYENKTLTEVEKEKKLSALYKDLFLYANESEDLKYNIADTTSVYDMDGCSVAKSYYERLFLAKATGILENKTSTEITSYAVNYVENLYDSYAFSMYCRALAYAYRAQIIDKYGTAKDEKTGLMSVDEEKIISFFEYEYVEGFDTVKYELTKVLVYILGLDLNFMYTMDVNNPEAYAKVPYKSLNTLEISEATVNNQVQKGATVFMNKIPQHLQAISDPDKLTFRIASGESLAQVDNNGKVSVIADSGSFTVEMLYDNKNVYSMTFVIGECHFVHGGNGTEDFPYMISTKEEFEKIREYPDKYFSLIDDINLNENPKVYPDSGNSDYYYNFEPIPHLSGGLDGKGHTIRGMKYSYIAGSIPTENEFYLGLFKTNSGIIQNLKIKYFDIKQSHSEPNIRRTAYVGNVCGVNTQSGRITGVTVENSDIVYELGNSSNDDNSSHVSVGGICGINLGELKKSGVNGSYVSGTARVRYNGATAFTYVGGITGMNGMNGQGSVSLYDCYSYGNTIEANGFCVHGSNIFKDWSGNAYIRYGGIAGSAESGMMARCLVIDNEPLMKNSGAHNGTHLFVNYDETVGLVMSGARTEKLYEYEYDASAVVNPYYAFDLSWYDGFVENGWTKAENGAPCFEKSEGEVPSAALICREKYIEPHTIELESLPIYEYAISECGGEIGTWQHIGLFDELEPGTPYKIYVRSKENWVSNVSISAAPFTVFTSKYSVEPPKTPQLESKTATSVELKKTVGYEYSTDGLIWQESNVFDGLKPDTKYTFYHRIAETDKTYASEKSEGLPIETLKVICISGIGDETVNFFSDSYYGKIYVALYDEQNRVVAVYTRKCAENVDVTPEVGITYSEIRIFLWNGDHLLTPDCDYILVR